MRELFVIARVGATEGSGIRGEVVAQGEVEISSCSGVWESWSRS